MQTTPDIFPECNLCLKKPATLLLNIARLPFLQSHICDPAREEVLMVLSTEAMIHPAGPAQR